MHLRTIFIGLFLFASGLTTLAQTKYSNEFLKIGVGARSLGMSNSAIAGTKDVTSSYWNPAGLVRMEDDFQVAAMHAEIFAGIAAYNYFGLGVKLDERSALSFSLIRFGVDDIPNTARLIDNEGNIDFNRVTFFSAADYAGIVSYSRKTNIDGLTLGGSAKIIHRKVGDISQAWGFGLDAGAQFVKNKWTFAAMGRDITGTFNAWSSDLDEETEKTFLATGNELPGNSVEVTVPELVLGINRAFQLTTKIALEAEVNFINTFDGKRNTLLRSNVVSMDPNMGFEASLNQKIFLRGGIGNFQVTTDISGNRLTTVQPNFGLGVKFSYFTVDYAFTNLGEISVAQSSNIFSLRIDINKGK
jgi:hypothetical protein